MMLKHFFKLAMYKLWFIRKHCYMVCRLQIIKRYMIINSMSSGIIFLWESRYSWIMIALTPCHHLSKAIVCPYFYHIIRQLQVTVTIQLHSLSVQICAVLRIRYFILDIVSLKSNELAHQFSP